MPHPRDKEFLIKYNNLFTFLSELSVRLRIPYHNVVLDFVATFYYYVTMFPYVTER